jgi:hypothetical protein
MKRDEGLEMIKAMDLPGMIEAHLSAAFDRLVDSANDICGEHDAFRAMGEIDGMLTMLTEDRYVSEDDAWLFREFCEKQILYYCDMEE